MSDNYTNIKLNNIQVSRLKRYLLQQIDIEENEGKKRNFISLKESVEKAIAQRMECSDMDIQELYHKVENQKKRIKDQNKAIEKSKIYKDLMLKIMKQLSDSKYSDSQVVGGVIGLISDTLFGLSKKKGGTISKGTIKKAKNKMLKKYSTKTKKD